MIYDCKLIIKDSVLLDEDCIFHTESIYIKYKPQGKFFYNKFYILGELYNIKCKEEDNWNLRYDFIDRLKVFNEMSMEEIKNMLIKYIMDKNNEQIKEKDEESDLIKQVNIAKAKQSKFTIEI